MKKLKPATTGARRLRAKLEALAAAGIDGERTAAAHKLARLMARYDWHARDVAPAGDILAGKYQLADHAQPIVQVDCPHTANAIKWAVESACGVPCLHRGDTILALATPSSCRRLAQAARSIAEGFAGTWQRFCAATTDATKARPLFFMGLYDGMMNEPRTVGQRLPEVAADARPVRAKRKAVARPPGLSVHPYTLAVSLGRQIRFAAPTAQLFEAIDRTIAGTLPANPNP